MAEILLSALAKSGLEKISSLFLSEISLASDVKKELKKLEMTLSTIRSVLLDAEAQQAKNHTVRDWLEKLRDVVYDVDDLLDEFSTEALRRKVEIHGSILKGVGNFFSRSNPLIFRFKNGHKIKDIRERLDNIAEDRRNFHFTEQVENSGREQTHSFVRASDVIGRDHDKGKIVNLLLSSGDRESLSVIPIVGLGGLGKTTLAKLVYNDDKVIQSFEMRMWACVSEDFKLEKVIEKIIESATNAKCDRLDMEQLQTRLRNILRAKKFLLVLDDVWNEDRRRWTELRDLLSGSANGSTIIVTTRSVNIASIMGTIAMYNLNKLPFDDCVSLLKRCAFGEVQENVPPELVEVGKEIVNKCGGVPLAVITLGSLLHLKTDLREWLHIRDNEMWKLGEKENDILPALRISYEKLPSYLKHCFAYCSIFPKNLVIGRNELIYLWIAQGLIQPLDENQELEDIGNQYFNELAMRSFFQDLNKTFESEISSCKMHDLIHDLAELVSGTEHLNVNFNSKKISENVRRVLFTEVDFFEKEFPASLVSANKLRSFTFAYRVGPVGKCFVDTLVSRFSCLRVLDLGHSDFEELPSFVDKLKHLRYLRLSNNRHLKTLPNSICKLLNLQSLVLNGCERLQDLPRHVEKLISLRYLNLTSQLVCLPEKGLHGLTSLRFLWLNQCNGLTSLSEGIQHLTSLRRLIIQDCPSLTSLPSGMKHLIALESLQILRCQELNLLEGEDLEGLRSLQSLSITGLPKLVALPRGLQQSAATLQYLTIVNCSSLTTLTESLQNLTSLLKLQIWECPNISSLPEGLQNLTSLQELYILECPNLLSLPEGMQRLTALRLLYIRGCPNLSRRYNKVTGEDWSKISHIPQIYFAAE
ncbi:hypothetical protein L1049_007945 [Liquidambar formosana]|uniref:Uncharacterized protein n=1 Tax=Liquidambar formosana TaxID=63359 RepID=A0AAP0S931_LIQFO